MEIRCIITYNVYDILVLLYGVTNIERSAIVKRGSAFDCWVGTTKSKVILRPVLPNALNLRNMLVLYYLVAAH